MTRRAAKGKGRPEPERPLMSAISDALQIEHFTCARGSTVQKNFLLAVADALKIDHRTSATKDDLLRSIIRKVSDVDAVDYLSKGETVTNAALRLVLEGISQGGLACISLTDGGAAARIAAALYDESFDISVFDPLELSDERKRSLRMVVVREGRGSFRSTVFNAYEGRCAITGCGVPEALEAAHIRPYTGPKTNQASNGILLRSDLHRLWDTGLLAVHESGHRVIVAERLIGTDYSFLAGRVITLPDRPGQRPSFPCLEQQRQWAGL